ncbi:hypothetical protein LB553_05455 [Mesorhizobium sp. CA8]|uniref:hypothetical protein n=1 Tax=Mesorhizobium sp. CA8 TaxID=2876637 RepID=UPI001CCD8455|nr:hypothetical protein [Mesorhizobium sp. CA8]MBZ9760321.1 hypothetical protein [Mesorhizobium sp. CA8]
MLEQIDVVLAENGRTIVLYGYGKDDALWMQSFDLPDPIKEENLDHQQWRAAARPEAWRAIP